MFSTTGAHLVSLFVKNWITPYGTTTHVLTDSESQFMRKLFERICAFLGTEHISTKLYHLQTSRQEKYSIKTIIAIARLQHYVAEYQKGSDIYNQPVT